MEEVNIDARYRDWCFSLWKPEICIKADPRIRYYVYQQERGGKQKGLHWQGYIEFYKAIRRDTVKKIIGDNSVHLERRRGTQDQAAIYCTPEGKRKDGSPKDFVEGTQVSWGQPAHQGERIDIHTAIDDIRNGRESEALDFYLFRYPGGYRALEEKYNVPPKRDDFHMTYIYGPPGTGKSTMAEKLGGDDAFWMLDHNPMWLDGYRKQKTIILNDFTGITPLPMLLQLCDKYKLQLPRKFGFPAIHATHVIFTSNKAPSELYEGNWQKEAWLDRFRRFGKTIYLDHVWEVKNSST